MLNVDQGGRADVVVFVTVLLTVLGLVVLPPSMRGDGGALVGAITEALIISTCATVGRVILRHRPGHRVGWIYLLIALGFAATSFASSYARRAVADPALDLPGAWTAALLLDPLWLVTVAGGAALLLLHFPTGRLPSPRWRVLPWMLGVGAAAAVTGMVLTPGPMEYLAGAHNPLGLPSSASIVEFLLPPAFVTVVVSVLAAVVSLLLRWHRSHGIEREQMKWLALGATASFVLYLAPQLSTGDPLPGIVRQLLYAAQVLVFPLASAIAILRHRLYDIDRIISRTVSYATLSVLLIGVYGATVTATSMLIPGTRTSPIAVAASTLTVAALFRPARTRVQRTVDRRFHRSRYDAVRVIEDYRRHIRTVVDLDAVSNGLVNAVQRSVHPTTAAIWLRAGHR